MCADGGGGRLWVAARYLYSRISKYQFFRAVEQTFGVRTSVMYNNNSSRVSILIKLVSEGVVLSWIGQSCNFGLLVRGGGAGGRGGGGGVRIRREAYIPPHGERSWCCRI